MPADRKEVHGIPQGPWGEKKARGKKLTSFLPWEILRHFCENPRTIFINTPSVRLLHRLFQSAVLLGAFPVLPAAKWEKRISSEALQESLGK